VWKEYLLRSYCFLLHNIVLQDDIHDHWVWLLDPIKDFLVRDVCNLFTTSDHISERVSTTIIWLKHVPLKVTLFAWCLFRNHLSTKDSLILRSIVPEETTICVGGCGFQESADHLLSLAVISVSFRCKFDVGLASLR